MNATRAVNPYGVRKKPKRKPNAKGSRNGKGTAGKPQEQKEAATQLAFLKKDWMNKDWMKNFPAILSKSPKEMRASLKTVRDWSSQMRGTMSQMENTLDTLHNLIGMYERWTARQAANTTEVQRTAGGKTEKVPLSLIKTFNSIDFRQIINVLNSPLLQAFMELNGGGDDEEGERKEG
ncbi:hypothetical protein PP175_09235 [Aneurinibacillus sp. Ricciae_BoGa-3]|uniref:hypothetical protein n=1 Tax=Aneurinibacillus sp. Ricciae_BoGa-3 TaxID=3022697 RepID=UPI00233FAF5D|nr:hypothetical protein [Aneurinibacillus sp. Ricciae_BoGa-3]WCK56070.1 hypothetical protein PP175_09235 [Aneurinibacillus sp. Ricciae_BoGa-3]